MKQVTKYCYVIPVCITLSACSMFTTEQSKRLCADDNGSFTDCQELPQSSNNVIANANTVHFVQLNEYTQQLARELKADLPFQGLSSAILVRPFEYAVEQNQDGPLSALLAEFLADDLRDLGVSTSDKSLNNYLYRTDTGEIEYSDAQHQALEELGTGYLMVGKLLNNQQGVMLSVKIVELKNGHLVASANKFLPNLVLKSV